MKSIPRLLRILRGSHRGAGDARCCPVCRNEFPCPMEWGPVDEARWWIWLRCGNCEHWYETTISNERAKRLDAELDGDTRAIERALEHIVRASSAP